MWGGAPASSKILCLIRLEKWLCQEFEERWTKIDGGEGYTGIHIRNTDMKSDFKGTLDVIKALPDRVFVATDSAQVQNDLACIRAENLYMSKIPDFGGKPLHHFPVNDLEKTEITTTAILDLLILGLSRKCLVSNINSGYSKLALMLQRNPRLILSMIDRRNVSEVFYRRLRARVIHNWIFNFWLAAISRFKVVQVR